MSTALVVLAFVLATIAALIGFDVITTDTDYAGWLAASLAAYFAASLVPE